MEIILIYAKPGQDHASISTSVWRLGGKATFRARPSNSAKPGLDFLPAKKGQKPVPLQAILGVRLLLLLSRLEEKQKKLEESKSHLFVASRSRFRAVVAPAKRSSHSN